MGLEQMTPTREVVLDIYKPLLFTKRKHHNANYEKYLEMRKQSWLARGFTRRWEDWAHGIWVTLVNNNLPERYRQVGGEKYGPLPVWVENPEEEELRRAWLRKNKDLIIIELCLLNEQERVWFKQAMAFTDTYSEMMEFALFGGEMRD